MNRFFFIFLPLFLYSINFPYKISLKKDEFAYFTIYYKKFTYKFKFRWTLYKNKSLVVIYHFDDFVRHVELFKDYPLNSFKVKIAEIFLPYPYFYIKFLNFDGKIAEFEIFLFNKKDVKVKEEENGFF